jgi:hypothetical protein
MLTILSNNGTIILANLENTMYVYIVLEHSDLKYQTDAILHGVFSTREIAENKKLSLHRKRLAKNVGYVSVLKKRIKGPVA